MSMSGSQRPAVTLNIEELIDGEPVGWPQFHLLGLCAAVLFVDGFDAQAIGYVAPALARSLGLSRNALGPVFSAGLVGLMIGALAFGPLADRYGRKRVIVVSVAAFGLGALATMLANDAASMYWLRFLTGLGLGGAMPNAIALSAEFSPHRLRATMVMLIMCGLSAGAALGGLLAAALIPLAGWRSVFFVGGAAPLALAFYIARALPELPRFLALSGAPDAEIARALRSVFPQRATPGEVRYVISETRLAGLPVGHLFRGGRGGGTVLLWAVFFASLLDLYFLSNWLPTVVSELGATDFMAALIGSMLQVGGIVGALALGRFIGRYSFRALSLTYLLAAFAMAAIGFSANSLILATVAIFCSGFCIVGAQSAANALAAEFYPTGMRSTGVGWALGVGRIGSIIGPLIGGELLALNWSKPALFLAAAVPAACGAFAALALDIFSRSRSVESRSRPRRAELAAEQSMDS